MCVLTVALLRKSAVAISPFDIPAAINFRTSTSRELRPSGGGCDGADAGACPSRTAAIEPLLNRGVQVRVSGGKRADGLLDLLGARVLGEVPTRTSLERGKQ